MRFFNAWDDREPGASLRAIARDYAPSRATGARWLKQRDELGSPAHRRTRQMSKVLGRRSRISKETCQMLVSPSRNPVRDQLYEAQIEYHNLPVKRRQLQKKLKEHTKGGQRYKQAYVRKEISAKNRTLRTKYGEEHKDKSIHDFWQFLFFTDEAHIDPSSMAQGCILREQGHRYDTENIQERGEKTGVKLHIAAWINWHEKADKLEFYNNEEEHIERPRRPLKPRTRKYESNEEFQARIRE